MENSFDNAHFAFVHKGTFGDINQPKPEKYEITETDYGFVAETIVTVRNPPNAARITGSTEPTTKRIMRNHWYLPFCRTMDMTYPSGLRHVIFNCATPIDDGSIQLIANSLSQRPRGGLLDGGADRLGQGDHRGGSRNAGVDRSRRHRRHEPQDRDAHALRPARHDHAQPAHGAARAHGEVETPR